MTHTLTHIILYSKRYTEYMQENRIHTSPILPLPLTTKTQYKYRKQALYAYITSSSTVEGAPCADEGATCTPKTDVTANAGHG
jgi:hypothetical protein